MFAIRLLQKAKNQHHNNNQVYFQTSIRIQPRPMMQRKHCCIIVYLAALRNNRGDHNVEGLLISPKQLRCKNLESAMKHIHIHMICVTLFSDSSHANVWILNLKKSLVIIHLKYVCYTLVVLIDP
ncbi:uncharacterized protein LOC113308397 isoform X1 [Papaver somniferum]|uniref:uncharacterized protein LOC113308397 isoform X1 n=1 Tax=Papaver somniferum TaxID=3469 RepID=UPI000E6FD872|nr:uncharacterized protein LOC113308397 isoform X1 [Papaver somniferum]